MELTPFKKLTDVPNRMDGTSDVLSSSDLIDIMDAFLFEITSATNESYYRGVSGYLFDAQLFFGFDENYKITEVEFREPFNLPGIDGLLYKGKNLLLPTLLDVENALKGLGIKPQTTDVGFEAKNIGVSFFSSDYEDNLNVRLDAVTVHFNHCE